ncbi:MAG TPA: thiamine biosynthesis protein ThiS [Nitrospirales bacterium]|jgi:sulfur carrier protein|nr:thiamine biosynthesis protein ThiS [Nitrospirales bacterium]HIA13819.1 thiamine biosynthesis protein ThiS [Nitrospirales bacterium]HIB54005.1 thiamine biosynthesis protein ThiS [Nitrospirales bacterium]HIC03998.1 thiamine biosynthesis protein ThiS [Nitrospirales bacterium]HIN33870.1 thiamine biosynthesis protein ThiS [Nitrospirales bacterium]
MIIHLSQPDRNLELQGPKQVKVILKELKIVAETVLVIRDDGLLTEDEMVRDSDSIEIRPVISGGA